MPAGTGTTAFKQKPITDMVKCKKCGKVFSRNVMTSVGSLGDVRYVCSTCILTYKQKRRK